MKNDGSESEEIFIKRMEQMFGKSVYINKLTDTKSVKRFNRQAIVKKTPADFTVTHNSMWYAEVKSTQNKTSFPFSMFTEGQIIAMTRQRAANGHYEVYIHNLNTDEWYVMPGNAVLELMDKGKSSIKWKDIPKWVI